MEAEMQARAKVARSKGVWRKGANKTDVVVGQVREGRGSRIGMKIRGAIFLRSATNTLILKTKHKLLLMALQLPGYDQLSTGLSLSRRRILLIKSHTATQVFY